MVETVVKISQTKKPNRYKVLFDSGVSLRVSEDVLVRHRLLKGTTLDTEALQQLRHDTAIDEGYQRSLHYLSYQLRSEAEVKRYLRDHEIAEDAISDIMGKLKELKLIDDTQYAESYVRTQMRMGDKGPQVVLQQLRKRGIAPDCAEEALSLYDTETALENAAKLAEKAFRRYRKDSFQHQQQKVLKHLVTKGFSFDVGQAAIDVLEIEPDEEAQREALVRAGEKIWRSSHRLDEKARVQKVKQGLARRGFSFEMIQAWLDDRIEGE
ncbi:recombination regulator RecX [Vagococcus lutrae]|uniref:recombination regulator RecX n=1 Tax=Vagococcus lutrae TaxID=81947 RepID=UPI002A8123C5|nr:recombination regulator RecX [Vagococcus lutrae]MDY3705369.1 recombination regulator RecX [Vagococcus lutrae]